MRSPAQGAGSATFSSSLVSSTKPRKNISSASPPIRTTRKRKRSFSTFASRRPSEKRNEILSERCSQPLPLGGQVVRVVDHELTSGGGINRGGDARVRWTGDRLPVGRHLRAVKIAQNVDLL